MTKRRTFESVARQNEARRCATDLRKLGADISYRAVISYWRGIDQSYRAGSYRWLDRCRMARSRAGAGVVGA